MQLIIDIPDKNYEEYKMIGDSRDILFEAIRNGIKLPKEYKRLIDEEEVIKIIDLNTHDKDGEICLNDDITCILENVNTIKYGNKYRKEQTNV